MYTYTRNFIDIMRYKDKVLIYQEKLWSCLTTLYTTSDRFHKRSVFACGIQGARHDYYSIRYVYKTSKYECWMAYASVLKGT